MPWHTNDIHAVGTSCSDAWAGMPEHPESEGVQEQGVPFQQSAMCSRVGRSYCPSGGVLSEAWFVLPLSQLAYAPRSRVRHSPARRQARMAPYLEAILVVILAARRRLSLQGSEKASVSPCGNAWSYVVYSQNSGPPTPTGLAYLSGRVDSRPSSAAVWQLHWPEEGSPMPPC